jgi:YVTN family beta-propeller protein
MKALRSLVLVAAMLDCGALLADGHATHGSASQGQQSAVLSHFSPPSEFEAMNPVSSQEILATQSSALEAESETNTPCSDCFRFDVDGDGEVLALTDGLILIRYLFGFRDEALLQGAESVLASRQTGAVISSFLDSNIDRFDVDGDGYLQALTDGLIVIRYLFGFEGSALLQGAQSASAIRTSLDEVAGYILRFIDSDRDGSANAFDAFPNNAEEMFDTDLDGLGNNRDFDDDGDGVLDGNDAWPLITLGARPDLDKDGRPDDCDLVCVEMGMSADNDDDGDGIPDIEDSVPLASAVGRPMLLSPHGQPIAIDGGRVFTVNTPSDTLDVIDLASQQLIQRIKVGVDPVSIAVRPDGREVWVSNHVSDTVSVVDADETSPTYLTVIATIQDLDAASLSTRFDEPIGIAFANNQKAYVALGPSNEIAIIDAQQYRVSGRLPIAAQDPRAIAVKNDRLYVVPFESNNQSQLSGCLPSKIDGDRCTYDAVEHAFTNNNVLSLNYDADIVKNSELPDRDLFVFDTETDQLKEVVEGLGTLLYGLAVDQRDRVFITQTDARNTANGRAGTLKEGLGELQNRAFLNRVTRIDCGDDGCAQPKFYDLEPLPPINPEFDSALATPYGLQVSEDSQVLVGTAAGSDRLFTMDAESGAVLGQVGVGGVPRGVVLESGVDGIALRAWVLNAVGNSVSIVDLSSFDAPRVERTILLEDQTNADFKRGRLAFNSAKASSTGTFSCASCHPDGHTDQLLWVLNTPRCDVDGCTQIPPRLTMPIRGLRDTEPYHWDGIPGDPFGGNNTASIREDVEPNCELGSPVSCARFLVDATLRGTMCDQTDCGVNDENKPGKLGAADREALSEFVLSFPYPPAPERPFDNALSEKAKAGFLEFNLDQDCGNCHRMPFLVSTNTPGTGMDAPTWRGAYDRWMILPQGRINVIDLMNIVGMPDHFPEEEMWKLAGATDSTWQMVVESNTGQSGSFGRQITLMANTVDQERSNRVMAALEQSAIEEGIVLQGEGRLLTSSQDVSVQFRDGLYREVKAQGRTFSRSDLLQLVRSGELIITLTALSGKNVGSDYPQPGVWPLAEIQRQSDVINIPHLQADRTLLMNGRHVLEGAAVIVNGRKVNGSIRCQSGTLPHCLDEVILIELERVPSQGGMHFLQIQNPAGKFSNDMLFFSDLRSASPRTGNLIRSGGEFSEGDVHWRTVELNGTIDFINNRVEANVSFRSASQPWRVQLSHPVRLVAGQVYTLCYRARADKQRSMTAYLDAGANQYQSLSGGQSVADLTTVFQSFSHTWTVPTSDVSARVAFDFAQSSEKVYIDDIGLFEGADCGSP